MHTSSPLFTWRWPVPLCCECFLLISSHTPSDAEWVGVHGHFAFSFKFTHLFFFSSFVLFFSSSFSLLSFFLSVFFFRFLLFPSFLAHTGGESIFGEPFKDEFHSRLRFTHRGLLGMASDRPHSNASQFFITLDTCEWLNKKHTIFGKVRVLMCTVLLCGILSLVSPPLRVRCLAVAWCSSFALFFTPFLLSLSLSLPLSAGGRQNDLQHPTLGRR